MSGDVMGALDGLRVLELAGGVAVAHAGKLLADLGADVIRLEPAGGDATRRLGPFRPGEGPAGDVDSSVDGHIDSGGLHLFLDAGKRCELDEPERRMALMGEADVVVHDVTAGGLTAAGLEPAALVAAHPALVTCAITPFGLTGPYAGWRSEEVTTNHAGGWGWLSPGSSGRPDLPPLAPPGHQAEMQAGMVAAMAAVAAQERARRTGRGEHIDLSVQAHVASMLEAAFVAWTYPGWPADRLGVHTLNPWGIFECRDGLAFIVVAEQDQWLRLVELMGHPDWADDDAFASVAARNENADVCNLLVGEWLATQEVDAVWHAAQARRICVAPVLTMGELGGQAHLAARGALVEVDNPVTGPMVQPGPPAHGLAGWGVRGPAPRLGQHSGQGFRPRTAAVAAPPPVPAPVSVGAAVATTPDPVVTPPARPLEGVRVLDLTWVWAGPFAALQLAHLGADVIKVESAQRPCLGRRLPFHPPGVEPSLNTSGYFNQWNQAKRGISLDLGTPEGVGVARALAARCDVVVENFAPGVLERLGLGYDELRRDHPEIVLASVSGYGQTGPLRDYMAYGPTAAPLTGLANIHGYVDGPPSELGIAFGDPAAGMAAAWGVVAALAARNRTGQGSHVDVSLWESTLACQGEGWMWRELTGSDLERSGNRDPRWAPQGCYPCAPDPSTSVPGADPGEAGAWVAITCTTEDDWAALCAVVDADAAGGASVAGLGADAAWATMAGRLADQDRLDERLTAWTATLDRWEVTRRLQAAGVAAFPSLSPRDVAMDPHLEARGFLEQLEHPVVGRRIHAGVPWRLTSGPNGVRAAAPTLGQHTAEVLAEVLDIDADELDRLQAAGALGQPA